MSQRIRMFNYEIDSLTMDEAVDIMCGWIAKSNERNCHIVVTPNVNHTVLLQSHEGLQRVYKDASLILADGFPILLAARFLKRYLPERVAGSEFVPKLFERATEATPQTVFLLGAAEGVADRAAKIIRETYPFVQVVGTYSPPLGFEHDDTEVAAIIQRVNHAQPDILCVGLGAPKQELWLHQHQKKLEVKMGLCIGATIDFIAGEKPQAPIWMRRSGLEFAHRILAEPKRLTKRYLCDAMTFPRLVWREWRNG